jgi:hypothetical protein
MMRKLAMLAKIGCRGCRRQLRQKINFSWWLQDVKIPEGFASGKPLHQFKSKISIFDLGNEWVTFWKNIL